MSAISTLCKPLKHHKTLYINDIIIKCICCSVGLKTPFLDVIFASKSNER
nr:MAG TPA: hypothetical protein [Caudoviricetes sp.]